jgi:8-amino-7-oxononanoate synthase
LLDFTSALYLGFWHPSGSLEPWPQLTTGAPAALGVPVATVAAADRLAALLGTPRATLAPSTLHVFWDLFVLLAGADTSIHIDAGAYAIARWGVERAQARGTPAQSFRHHDPDALARALQHAAARGRRPLVLVDGVCPQCGAAPLPSYSELIARYGGLLVIDDTQALGVLGERRPRAGPFGAAGGGSSRWHSIAGAHIVLGASLAKGFGAPVAVLAGDATVVERFERCAATRMYCSAPPVASVRAAQHALRVNRTAGDDIRGHLARLVGRFRAGVAEAGLRPHPNLFPVQTAAVGEAATHIHDRLREAGVRAVVHRGHRGEHRLSFLITAAHREGEIDGALAALRHATAPRTRRSPARAAR